jgi:hypothetical protein
MQQQHVPSSLMAEDQTPRQQLRTFSFDASAAAFCSSVWV